MAKILTILKNKYLAIRGFKTSRKIVVIESDDWGSIRTPSKNVFSSLVEQGELMFNDPFLSNDCLENSYDLLNLYNVLGKIRKKTGKKPIITANFAMANPNFEQIDINDSTYVYEPFYDTYNKYYPNEDVLSVVKEGIVEGFLVPQLHCREHLNVARWIKDLKNGNVSTIKAFEKRMIGVYSSFDSLNPYGYMDSFNTNYCDYTELTNIISDAKLIFEKTFGYKSATFVPSCLVWDEKVEDALIKCGIFHIQSGPWQFIPVSKKGINTFKRQLRFMGQRNNNNITYSIRNCSFEPSYGGEIETVVEKCLSEIEYAFKHKKPAVINSHRVNYISSINKNNANKNLSGLELLLEKIIVKFPDVEFVSTPELVEMIRGKND